MSAAGQSKGLIASLLAALLLGGCCCCPWPQTEVTPEWSYAVEVTKPLVRFMPLASGGVLAATRAGDVVSIDVTGTERKLVDGTATPPYPRVVFNPGGGTFGVFAADGFSVYDTSGIKLSTLPHQPGAYKLVPASQRVYAPEVRDHTPENREVIKARILNHLGALQAEWPVPGLEMSRLTAQHLVYATDEELVKTTLAGTELWRAPVRVRKLKVANDGQRSLVNSARNSDTLFHYTEDARVGTDSLSGPVWNLAIAPAGQYSAATSQTELQIYDNGVRQSDIQLPLKFAVSVAVNDRGEALVGGQDTDGLAYVALYDRLGSLQWESRGEPDDHAWRPEVSFDAVGNRALVRFKERLASYFISRSP